MKIFDRYIEKQIVYEAFINEKPEKDLRNIIVIPCYNEPNFIQTLNSLNSCKPSQNPVEVIAVINSAAHSDSHVLLQNQKTKIEIESWQKNHKTKKLKIHFIFVENISSKYAGAGFARKIGMDEAIRRFKLIRNEMGIITSLDADSIVSDNYLAEIEQFFDDKPQLNGCSIYFEHPITGSEHPEIVYKRISEYELYLRYYSLSLKYTGFPHYFHTVGSSFAVRAKTYCKQGGMNRKKAGEDFYFLQKIMSLGNYEYLNTVTVIPSSRPSDRVPFGTGAFIKNNIEIPDRTFLTYNFEVFKNLHYFFHNIEKLFYQEGFSYEFLKLDDSLIQFLIFNNFDKALKEIKANTTNLNSFKKRFFNWFDAFRILKYQNFAHKNHYKKIPVQEAVDKYLRQIGQERINLDIVQLLETLRKLEKNM